MNSNQPEHPIVLDASQAILGRIASFAAKKALLGKKVVVVNCDKAVITGQPRTTINIYNSIRRRGGSSMKGPFFPKQPYRIMKRTIRGMLPHLQQRGVDALKRVRCYDSVPEEYSNSKMLTFHRQLKTKTLDIASLGREI